MGASILQSFRELHASERKGTVRSQSPQRHLDDPRCGWILDLHADIVLTRRRSFPPYRVLAAKSRPFSIESSPVRQHRLMPHDSPPDQKALDTDEGCGGS